MTNKVLLINEETSLDFIYYLIKSEFHQYCRQIENIKKANSGISHSTSCIANMQEIDAMF